MILLRRAVLSLPVLATLAMSGCAENAAPTSYPPPSYDYLTTLKLNVGRIEIDDSWAPRGASRRVEHLAPVMPREALRRMAEDRIVAGGTTGRAVFVVEDASIIRGPRNYEASLVVRLDMADDAGNRLGQATARVVQVRPVRDDSQRAVRDDLYVFVRDLMNEMNVEFEFQMRRAMRDALQSTSTSVPEPGPVEAETLGGPGAAPDATPAAPSQTLLPSPEPLQTPVTMSPPPGPLGAPGPAPVPGPGGASSSAPGPRPPTSLAPR